MISSSIRYTCSILLLIAVSIYLAGCGHDFSPIVGAWTQDHHHRVQRASGNTLSDTTIATSIRYDYLGDGTYHIQADSTTTSGTYIYAAPRLTMTDRTGSATTYTIPRIKDYEMTLIQIDTTRGVISIDSLHLTR